jgi:hypothetical protein
MAMVTNGKPLSFPIADQLPAISSLPGTGGGRPVQEWLHGCELHGWSPHRRLRISNPNA